MSTGLRIDLVGDKRLERRLEGFGKRALPNAMRQGLRIATQRLKGHIQKPLLTGEVLNVRSGELRRGITAKVFKRGNSFGGIVGTPTEYAKTHELGLTIQYPSRGTSIKFPKRPFFSRGLEEQEDKMINDVRESINAAIASFNQEGL